jgi:hypothetical protein
MNQCGLIVPEINLILYTFGAIDDRLDGRFHNLSGVHVDAEVVADFQSFIVRDVFSSPCRLFASTTLLSL